jgi:hypothetical protein
MVFCCEITQKENPTSVSLNIFFNSETLISQIGKKNEKNGKKCELFIQKLVNFEVD